VTLRHFFFCDAKSLLLRKQGKNRKMGAVGGGAWLLFTAIVVLFANLVMSQVIGYDTELVTI